MTPSALTAQVTSIVDGGIAFTHLLGTHAPAEHSIDKVEVRSAPSRTMAALNLNGEPSLKQDGSSVEALHDRLDDLWIRYLDLVTAYEAAQASIQAMLSKAFFDLAAANFSKPSGRRYGRDYYDQRAIASIRTKVTLQEDRLSVHAVQLRSQKSKDDTPQTEASNAPSDRNVNNVDAGDPSNQSQQKSGAPISEKSPRTALSVQQLLTPEATPEPAESGDDRSPASELKAADASAEDTAHVTEAGVVAIAPSDPLRSFSGGVLISPSLRKAHRSFAGLFEQRPGDTDASSNQDPVSKAANAARRMREVEIEIRRLRKTIKKAERNDGGEPV